MYGDDVVNDESRVAGWAVDARLGPNENGA